MNKTETVIRTLYDSALENGLIRTLEGVYGSRCVLPLPLSRAVCGTSITALELRTRGDNGLRRLKVETIGQLADIIAAGELDTVRNFGDKTVREIKTRLVLYVWGQMDEQDKLDFLRDVALRNRTPGA